MNCRKCGTKLCESNIKIGIVEHGEEQLDIIIKCPECEHAINDFVPITDFIDID